MSAAQHNRGSKRISQDIREDSAQQRERRLSLKNTDKYVVELEQRVERAENAMGEMSKTLKETQATLDISDMTVIELTGEATRENKRAELYKKRILSLMKLLEQSKAGHLKLSKIMRLALSPEEYHRYRGIVEEG